jgi:RimJ/RimL family protein N-acetyltransferase
VSTSTARVRLFAQDAAMLDALGSADAFRRAYGAEIGSQLDFVRGIVAQTLDYHRRIRATPPWIGYTAVREGSNEVIGTCSFKGDPDGTKTVEIAYFTFPQHEGQGLATAMARALVALARADGGVRRVIAHTLPERNASTRVLDKAGFAFAGDVVDPEDGPVWRFSLDLGELEEIRAAGDRRSARPAAAARRTKREGAAESTPSPSSRRRRR